MFDTWVLKVSKTPVEKLAKLLAKKNIHPNFITLLGFLIALLAFVCIILGFFELAMACILLNRLCDSLDGSLARMTKISEQGAFLDIVFDFIFYSIIPLGFAIYHPLANALAASFIIFSFVCTGSSFLAFAILAEKKKIKNQAFPQKSFYYLGGLTEASETIAFFVLSCIFPGYFPIFAYIFGSLCLLTASMRLWYGFRVFS